MKALLASFLALYLAACTSSKGTDQQLSRSFMEGYLSATDTRVGNSIHSFISYNHSLASNTKPPYLLLEINASDHEVGHFCGEFNSYVTNQPDGWASAYRDSVSVLHLEEEHPAVIAAAGLALCSLLEDMQIKDAILELGIETPLNEGPFPENCTLDLGHDLWLLIKVDTSWPDSKIPPVEAMVIRKAYLYQHDESITSLLDWARLQETKNESQD